MNLTYTPVTPPQPKPGYTIHIECEHGDADLITCETVSLNYEHELVNFITAFKAAAAAIKAAARGGPRKLTPEVRDNAENAGVPLVYDHIYTDVYAVMEISKIQFVNSDGVEYIVSVDVDLL